MSYHDLLVDALRARKEALGLSNEWVEDRCQMAAGHVDKLLGPTRAKNLSRFTIDLLCELFAVDVVLVPNPGREAKWRPVWEHREDRNVRIPRRRLSKPLLERAKPLVVRQMGRDGGAARAACLTPSRREEIARSGGLAKARARRQRLKDALREQPVRRAE